MRIAIFGTALAIFVALLASSCSSGTSGGPGATPEKKKTSISDSLPTTQSKDTFSLDPPNLATKLKRGEAKATSIGVTRGTNATETVKISFDNLPKGVSIEPNAVTVAGTEKEAKITVKASNDAPIGDFEVKIVGHPSAGADATNTMKVSVSEQ